MLTAILRFSYCVVAVGKVPSTGMAETGRSLPLPAIMTPVTFWTNSGASAGTAGFIGFSVLTTILSFGISETACKPASTALLFMATTASPFFE